MVLKENVVNTNRKKIVNTFNKKGDKDIKKLSSMIDFNTPVLIDSVKQLICIRTVRI